MKIALLGVLLVPVTAAVLGGAAAVPGSTVAAQDRVTLKEDFSRENAKWKFVAGQWVRRTSTSRPVLAQTVETQPWAVAILEDQRFDDVDVTVRFRPISGQEDASGSIIFRRGHTRKLFSSQRATTDPKGALVRTGSATHTTITPHVITMTSQIC